MVMGEKVLQQLIGKRSAVSQRLGNRQRSLFEKRLDTVEQHSVNRSALKRKGRDYSVFDGHRWCLTLLVVPREKVHEGGKSGGGDQPPQIGIAGNIR